MHTVSREMPIEYDESTRTYQLSPDWGHDHPVTTAIVLGVSEITETSPIDIEPLYGVVDPDALDNLYAPKGNATLRRGSGSTSFRFHGCDVTVYPSGEIEIRPLDDTGDAAEMDHP